MDIQLIWAENQWWGVQRTASGQFHFFLEKYPYVGNHHKEGEIVKARLVYQALYAGDQWLEMPDALAYTTDRTTRRVYVDSEET